MAAAANPGDVGPHLNIGMIPQGIETMGKTATGLFVPKGLADKAAAAYAAKAEKQKAALAVRPTRKQLRAAGNERKKCRLCHIPVKAKNYNQHFVRLHLDKMLENAVKAAAAEGDLLEDAAPHIHPEVSAE